VRDVHRFEGDEAGFRSWVFVMAHHRLIDDLRRRRRRPETVVAPDDLGSLRDASDVAGEVERRHTEHDLRRYIERLTPPQRDVLFLRIFGGLTVEEVAKAVRRRPGAVKALQRRGLEALRGILDQNA
jgi:RNA polymerase sigma-70 factor (ECF subfamily)